MGDRDSEALISPTCFLRLAALLALPTIAAAADLGRLTLLSGVGEPLRAEIEIMSLRPGEAQSLVARVPSAEEFWQANIEPAPAVRSIRATVERRPQGRYVIALRSNEPMLEPFMDLLVELQSAGGRGVREYTFLLEEEIARRAPSIPMPTEEPPPPLASGAEMIRGAEAPEEITRARTAPPAPRPAMRAGEYLVKQGDTLASIAQAHLVPGATLEQMIVAIYQANPTAFIGENMNLLKVGQVLVIPDQVATLAIETKDARQIVLAHRAAFEEYRNRLARAVARAPARSRASRQSAGGPVAPKQDVAVPSQQPDQLRISKAEGSKGGGAQASAREDDIIALQRALGEAQERITLLERNLTDVRKLLELKNQQLAEMQNTARAPTGGMGQAAAAEADSPTPEVSAAAPNHETSITRVIARALAWVSLGSAAILAPIGGFVWWRTQVRERERQARKAERRHKRRARRHAERQQRRAREEAEPVSNEV